MKESVDIERRLCELEKPGSEFPVYLVVVLQTLESTYQKPGAVCLVEPFRREFVGLVSGGCLEEDLLSFAELHRERSEEAGTDAVWLHKRYDTRREEDDLLGTALGCRGCLDLAIIPVVPSLLRPLRRILGAGWSARHAGQACFRLLPCAPSEGGPFSANRDMQLQLEWSSDSEAEVQEESLDFCLSGPLPDDLTPLSFALPKRLLICVCGAGRDADSIVSIALELGIEVDWLDHRPAQLARAARVFGIESSVENFVQGIDAVREDGLRIQRYRSDLARQRPDGIFIMSHNLEQDRRYLNLWRDVNPELTYVGLLGPARRRTEVFAGMSEAHPLDHPCLRSPMGLPLGGRGSAEIALSVLAEFVQYARQRRVV